MQVCQVFSLLSCLTCISFPISILCNHILYVLINLTSTTIIEKEADDRPFRSLTQSESDLHFTMRFSPASFPGLHVLVCLLLVQMSALLIGQERT